MAVKKGNSVVTITLKPFHMRKIKLVEERTGLNKSDIIQRLIENYDLFFVADDKEQK